MSAVATRNPEIIPHEMAAKMMEAAAAMAEREHENAARAAGAYAAARAVALEKVAALTAELETHAEIADAANADYPGRGWHYVGDLSEVNRMLGELLAFVAGPRA